MRILGRDPGAGSMKVMPETDEDMWHLYNVLEAGDLLTASTTRREEKSADKIRAEKMEKKRMTLGLPRLMDRPARKRRQPRSGEASARPRAAAGARQSFQARKRR